MLSLRSFIDIPAGSDFPIQNLPYGVFKPRDGSARIGVAIGELILDVTALEASEHLGTGDLFAGDTLNKFLAAGKPTWRKVRAKLQELLNVETATLRDDQATRDRVFHKQSEVTMQLPARIGDYTDFYSSFHHAHNVGTMLRGPETALMPNWKWLPVAYHGRASSIVVSGTDVKRPRGQIKPPDAETPLFSASRAFDFELEIAFLIGPGNSLGEPISAANAEEHIFGFVLMNDWSARDIQTWEYQPLGPFLAKNFCTSISPWVVTMDALEPFRRAQPAQDPEPLPYLKRADDFTFDIQLEASLTTAEAKEPHTITRTNFANLYWSVSQQLAHHTVNGCNLQPGDLLASGTISGPTEDSRGCMLELTWRGANPLQLPGGESRKWLEDGDALTITGRCVGEDFRIGFGEVSGRVVPA